MRIISERFQGDLHCGILRPVLDAVKDRENQLILCVRNGYVNVYYKSHSLLKITEQRAGYRISFNIRHGRYTAPMDVLALRLAAICPYIRFTASDEAWFLAKEGMDAWLMDVIGFYKGLVDDFFDPMLTEDFIHPSRKRDLLEKVRQQELYMQHDHPCGSGEELVFYDMELSIPNASSAQRKKGSPDCLAVKLLDGVVTEIVLVEVKSTAAACCGAHGLEKHYTDFAAILDSSEDRQWLYHGMTAAMDIFRGMGMYKGVRAYCSFEDCRFSQLYCFTDAAVQWAEQGRGNDRNSLRLAKLHTEEIRYF